MIGKGKPEFGKIDQDASGNMALYANINKIKKKLHWSPKVSLREGLEITINSFK